MTKFLFIIALIVAMFVWYGESRKFFCLDNGRCVTVWKTYNNVCYIVPGKYYGITKPSSESYIQTTNTSSVDVIWQDGSDGIIVNLEDENAQIHKYPKGTGIVNYNLQKNYYDSLFMDFDGKYHRYKKGIDYISIFVQENYALDNNGKKL